MNSLVLRPRTATEIVDATFRVCRAHYGALITVMMVIIGPALLIGILTRRAWIVGIVENILYTVADGAIIAIVSEIYLGRRPEAGTGLRALRGRIATLIGASILRNFVVILGFILLIVPGLFMIAATFAVPMAIVVEGRSVSDSFTRARLLVEANLWHVARTLALLGVVVFGSYWGLAFVLGIVNELYGTGVALIETILSVVLLVIYPLISVGGTLLYYDLRIRTEGFDLEMMLQGLDPESTRTADAAGASGAIPIT